jgi:nitroreductase
MSAMKTVLEHRSIRKFESRPVEEEILNDILKAASRASTTGNMQVYSIIITRDTERKKKVWEFHFKQNMVLEAPLLLTFCADFNRFNTWCRQHEAVPGYDNFLSFMTAAIDALLAAQNAAVAAESHGLGICYLGTTTYMADKLIEFYNCPKGVIPVTTLVVGYPAETPGLTDRLPIQGIIHDERYQDYDTHSIDNMYREKESLPLTAALLEENQLPNLAQIFTQKRYTKKDNVLFSKKLLKTLQDAGFMNHEE